MVRDDNGGTVPAPTGDQFVLAVAGAIADASDDGAFDADRQDEDPGDRDYYKKLALAAIKAVVSCPAACLEWARERGVEARLAALSAAHNELLANPPTRTHRVAAGGWLDSFIGDAIDALARRPSITYLEYMRTRLERSPGDLDGIIGEPPKLFEHDSGVIVLSQVQSVTARVHMTAQRSGHGLTDCHVVLRSGADLTINAKYSNGLTQAVKAHHAGSPVMSVFLLDDKDRERARAGEVVPVPVAPATEAKP